MTKAIARNEVKKHLGSLQTRMNTRLSDATGGGQNVDNVRNKYVAHRNGVIDYDNSFFIANFMLRLQGFR